MERAAGIIAESLSDREMQLLLEFGRLDIMVPDDIDDALLSLLDLRLIERIGGGPKVIVTLFGREVLAHL
ncbi:hypothetical protein [uncultured Roseovarius sp.]|uniref:hypothetical protein n=1 Tax=uncultured Roseovarius sp. TaxID=293344 RepID=UPI002636F6A3|nr:hypothetical protein [uncultured Roseovarius sp.]